MPDKHYVFVDSRCPRCNGIGHYPSNPWYVCPRCNGTGSIGSYEEAPDIRLGEIERGFGDAPTPVEEKKIREWIDV